MKNNCIVGIDLGTGQLGLCRSDGKKFESAFIKTSGSKKLVHEYKQIKFYQLAFSGEKILREWIKNATLIVVEKPFNVKGHGQVLIELLGVVKHYCFKYKIPYCELAQTTIKKFATSDGRAEKSKMVMKAYKEFEFEAETEDEIDAFWCMMIGIAVKYGKVFKVIKKKKKGIKLVKARKEVVKKVKIIDVPKIYKEVKCL